jgi:hypothetical protein
VQRPLTSGPKGCLAGQTPLPAGPTLYPLAGLLHGHALQEAVTRNSKLEVGGSQTQWPASHVTRLAGQHLVCYRLNQLSNSSLDSYKHPLPMEFKTTHSTCSSSLVNVSI